MNRSNSTLIYSAAIMHAKAGRIKNQKRAVSAEPKRTQKYPSKPGSYQLNFTFDKGASGVIW